MSMYTDKIVSLWTFFISITCLYFVQLSDICSQLFIFIMKCVIIENRGPLGPVYI